MPETAEPEPREDDQPETETEAGDGALFDLPPAVRNQPHPF